MERIGMPFDYGMPPEVKEDHDLETLRQIAADVAAALDQAGALEIYEVHKIVLPLLDQAEERLHQIIQAHPQFCPVQLR